MGKRSKFLRIDKDHYPTPREAVLPLLPHISKFCWYVEPCGTPATPLTQTLFEEAQLKCAAAFNERIHDARITDYSKLGLGVFSYFITNPPWTRELLHPIIVNLSNQKPTWLLFDADWMHTKQAAPYLKRCRKIVSVGRVKWIKDSPYVGKDNACWYLFASDDICAIADMLGTTFIGRPEVVKERGG